jgi:C4-dicarboxylate-specific signal transduction histidine kinase
VYEPELRRIVCPDGNDRCEYVVAPLVVGGEVRGAVLADRAFLDPTDILPGRLELLEFLTGEFALMLEALKLRREEEEARIARELARGVSYSLRTRAAALEARISNLGHALGQTHRDAIDRLKRALGFFKRAGTIAARLARLEQIRPGTGERLDLNHILLEIVEVLADPRITFMPAHAAVYVQAERHYLEDVFLEILWNACDFTDRQKGKITVTLWAEEGMARVDCRDNGPGIHPEFRADLFKPFKCYPASRMGFGLSYVMGLVNAYGGTFQEIGTWLQGAHFVVRIPLVEGTDDEPG